MDVPCIMPSLFVPVTLAQPVSVLGSSWRCRQISWRGLPRFQTEKSKKQSNMLDFISLFEKPQRGWSASMARLSPQAAKPSQPPCPLSATTSARFFAAILWLQSPWNRREYPPTLPPTHWARVQRTSMYQSSETSQ